MSFGPWRYKRPQIGIRSLSVLRHFWQAYFWPWCRQTERGFWSWWNHFETLMAKTRFECTLSNLFIFFFLFDGVDFLLNIHHIYFFFHLVVLESLRDLLIFSSEPPLILSFIFRIHVVVICDLSHIPSEYRPWWKHLRFSRLHVIRRFNSILTSIRSNPSRPLHRGRVSLEHLRLGCCRI